MDGGEHDHDQEIDDDALRSQLALLHADRVPEDLAADHNLDSVYLTQGLPTESAEQTETCRQNLVSVDVSTGLRDAVRDVAHAHAEVMRLSAEEAAVITALQLIRADAEETEQHLAEAQARTAQLVREYNIELTHGTPREDVTAGAARTREPCSGGSAEGTSEHTPGEASHFSNAINAERHAGRREGDEFCVEHGHNGLGEGNGRYGETQGQVRVIRGHGNNGGGNGAPFGASQVGGTGKALRRGILKRKRPEVPLFLEGPVCPDESYVSESLLANPDRLQQQKFIFAALDVDRDGYLSCSEMRRFGEIVGFAPGPADSQAGFGSFEEWVVEFSAMCAAVGADPGKGLDEVGFVALTDDDESENGLLCSDSWLARVRAALSRDGRDGH